MASIRERVSRDGQTRWAVLYRHGKQTSKTFDDHAAAVAFKANIDAHGIDRALRMQTETEPTGLTVDQLAAAFLDHKARDVTARTMTDYRRDYANWIGPLLGHRVADDLDERDVQEWVDHMARRLAPKSVADRHMLLHSMYDFGKARSRRLVEHNPCQETELPRRTKQPPKGTTVPEFRAILETGYRRNPDAADLILFLGETGWRWSEAAALAVRDVEDFDDDGVWVTVSRVFRVDGSGRQYVAEDEAKSYAAFRRVAMLPESAAMVRRRLVGKGSGDLVFTNTAGRRWSQNTFLRETWPRIVADANLGEGRKPTPHWMRHMHVAVCDAVGMTPAEISRRIGHTNLSTTYGVYGGLIGGGRSESLADAALLMAGQRHAPGIAPVVRGELG